MTEYVVLLRTTGPDGDPWERVISPVFQSEAAADAWRSDNGLTENPAILTVYLNRTPREEERQFIVDALMPSTREAWGAGDPLAVIDALDWCVVADMPIPGWCGQLIHEAARRLHEFEAKTLDDAFGISGKIHKGTKLINSSQRVKFTGLAWETVNRLKSSGNTYERALELAAEDMKKQGFRGGEGVVKQLYREGKAILDTVRAHAEDKSTNEREWIDFFARLPSKHND